MKTPVPWRHAAREERKEDLPHSAFRIPHSQTGFTLLEVLVATGVLAIMVTILFQLFAEGSNAWRMGERTAEVNQGVRTAMSWIVRDVSLAVVDTNVATALNGLAVSFSKSAQGKDPANDPNPYGAYDELAFVAPVDSGNETTNNAVQNAYRPLCGVRYYVAKAPAEGGRAPILGNLTRVVHLANDKSSAPFTVYNTEWWKSPDPTGMTNSAVLAENVLAFRVHPARLDLAHPQGIRPENEQMFRDPGADVDRTVNHQNYDQYAGVYVGLCVVDARLASRIDQIGLSQMARSPQFHAYTNWVLVRFENFKPKP